MERERGSTLERAIMGETMETRSERISMGRGVDARSAVVPWNAAYGSMAERGTMGESTEIWIHQPT